MKISNKELLKIAEDESTDAEALTKIWITSKSIKVRKAIASNPNSSATVLRAAARLYMEEVLANPGFEMLRLFDDDPWIKSIGDIYESPAKYLGNSRYMAYRTHEMEQFGRAALLSPQLDGLTLSNIIEYVPVSSLKRVIKNEKVKNRLRNIIEEGYSSKVTLFNLEAIFKSWDAGLITTGEMGSYIRKGGAVSTMSCRKGVYLKGFRRLSKEYLEEKTADSMNTLSSLLLASRGLCFNWISYEIEAAHLPAIIEAFRASREINKKAAAGIIHGAYRSNSKTASYELAGLIVSIEWSRFSYTQRPQALKSFYDFVHKNNLPPYEWGNTKACWPAIKFDNDLCLELEKLPMPIQAFYARAKCIGDWVHLTASEAKSRIVNNVNQWLYERGGVENLLYKSIHLKKIIALSDNVVIP